MTRIISDQDRLQWSWPCLVEEELRECVHRTWDDPAHVLHQRQLPFGRSGAEPLIQIKSKSVRCTHAIINSLYNSQLYYIQISSWMSKYRYFMRKKLALGFETMTFWFASSCQDIAFLIGIYKSQFDYFALLLISAQGGLGAGTKTTTPATGNNTLSLYIQQSSCPSAWLTTLSSQVQKFITTTKASNLRRNFMK